MRKKTCQTFFSFFDFAVYIYTHIFYPNVYGRSFHPFYIKFTLTNHTTYLPKVNFLLHKTRLTCTTKLAHVLCLSEYIIEMELPRLKVFIPHLNPQFFQLHRSLTMPSPYLKSIYPVTLELYERQMKYFFIQYISSFTYSILINILFICLKSDCFDNCIYKPFSFCFHYAQVVSHVKLNFKS